MVENSVFYEMEYIPPIAFFCLRKISSHPKPFRTFTLIIYTKGLKNKIHCIFYRPCFITSWLKMALVLSHRGLHCFIPLYFSVNFSLRKISANIIQDFGNIKNIHVAQNPELGVINKFQAT